MKILLINPNTDVEMTATIDKVARKYASSGTEVTTVNPPDGPIFIPNAFASFDRAIIHPSLFDNTTTGISFNLGLKTLSQEA